MTTEFVKFYFFYKDLIKLTDFDVKISLNFSIIKCFGNFLEKFFFEKSIENSLFLQLNQRIIFINILVYYLVFYSLFCFLSFSLLNRLEE